MGMTLVFWLLARTGETPWVEKGRTRVVTDAEAYSRSAPVHAAAATREYVFLNHGQNGVVSVYDWAGNYCFTIVTSSEGNGVPELYCVENKLFLIDKNAHVFVYDGAQLVDDYQMGTREQGSELRASLRARENGLVTVNETQIMDKNGNPAFDIPGEGKPFLQQGTTQLGIVIVGLFLCAGLVFVSHIRSQK